MYSIKSRIAKNYHWEKISPLALVDGNNIFSCVNDCIEDNSNCGDLKFCEANKRSLAWQNFSPVKIMLYGIP